MGVLNNINKVLTAKYTGICLFGVTGAYKMFVDYKRAPKEDKRNTLFREAFILGGSAGGLALYSLGRNSFVKSPLKKSCNKQFDKLVDKFKNTKLWEKLNTTSGKFIKKPIATVLKHGYNVVRDCLDNTMLYASGLLGAVGADYLIQIAHTHRKIIDNNAEKKKAEVIKESNVYIDPVTKLKAKFMHNKLENDFDKVVDEDTKNNILSNITNMPEMRVFTNTMIGLEGLRIAEEKTFKDKLTRTTNSLLKGTLVPMFYLSLASNITKGMKGLYRVPLVFSTMVAGTMFTNKAIDKNMHKKGIEG